MVYGSRPDWYRSQKPTGPGLAETVMPTARIRNRYKASRLSAADPPGDCDALKLAGHAVRVTTALARSADIGPYPTLFIHI
jgi:hypothetical protein